MDAIVWILLIAAAGLLLLYFVRRTKTRDPEAEFGRYARAAASGDVYAQYLIGKMLLEGDGVKADRAEALIWLRRSAEQDHTEAQCILAQLLESGDGGAEGLHEAYAWYQRAAEQGHERAGDCLLDERWTPFREQSSAESPSADEKPLDSADMDTYLRQAQDGDMDAQYNLGILFYNGKGMSRDLGEAARWFLLAAEQGDADARYNLGLMYGRGEGVDKNLDESRRWLLQAAEQGHEGAREIVNKLYRQA